MAAYNFVIPTANVSSRLEIYGYRIAVVDAAGDIDVTVDGPQGTRTARLTQGGTINYGDFKFSSVSVVSAVAQTVVLDIGRDNVNIPRKKIQAELVPADTVTDYAHGPFLLAAGASFTFPADTTRKLLYLQNPASNTANFHVGAAPGAAQGLPIPPGVTVGLAISRAVTVYNAAGVSQQFYAMSLSDA